MAIEMRSYDAMAKMLKNYMLRPENFTDNCTGYGKLVWRVAGEPWIRGLIEEVFPEETWKNESDPATLEQAYEFLKDFAGGKIRAEGFYIPDDSQEARSMSGEIENLENRKIRALKLTFGLDYNSRRTLKRTGKSLGDISRERVHQYLMYALKCLREYPTPFMESFLRMLRYSDDVRYLPEDFRNRADKYEGVDITKLDISVLDGLNIRTRNGIRKIGTIGALITCKRSDILKKQNVGPKGLEQIEHALKKQFGLALRR